ncbi:phenylalanine--tRNA ligase subunit beta [Ereboglobus luteus]|uniref:Phenylalanine--tRNA ligase beta subunit n=1 Tax=Ereboglobus luteus TaxID=1796921 RepID=A0A2U8DZ63_9BACT|nr:phenylalanine--tRNA ligase subunit beta [Ereboglobus luteus]AWI07913.1 phenylalanine--tRNA ligase subunit beta [Ereboglobus luteus]
MKISLSWLNDYVDLSGIATDEISRAITFLGLEVEEVINTGAPQFNNVVVGRILTRDKHPNADKLSLCTVDVGPAGGVKTIVCGAPNCDAGNLVPVALPGAILPGNFEIKQSKIRGQSSDGMMCSSKELALEGGDHAGLMILATPATETPPALGTPINDILPPGDIVFDIEVTPNRPDCLSHIGIARELSAWFKKPLRYPEIKYDPRNTRAPFAAFAARPDLLESIRVDAPEMCPLYTATVITGIKIGPSPEWMQRRLLAAGMRPISNIVDISNYVMLEYGQPTHAFDAKKIGGHKLIIRPANEGEKIITLDEKERALSSRMLVIADAEKPLVIAGVMGGENSGIDDTTTDIILEAASFARSLIRWTSRRLGLSSDSSYRYERGVDPHMLDEATRRAISLILELCGGQVAGATHKAGGDVPWQREVQVTASFVNERVGFEIPVAEQRAALEALELRITREDKNAPGGPAWTVAIPSWRNDLDRPIDLVEDVLRVYGTEKIPPAPVLAPTIIGNDAPIVLFNREVSAYLVGQGFNECVNYTLRSKREVETWVSQAAGAELALLNPFTEDQSHLRPTLVLGLLETLKLNQSRGVPTARLFETGRVFIERDGQNFECVSVAFIIAENDLDRAWLKREPADFYTTKRLVETLAGIGGIDIARQPVKAPGGSFFGWQEGQSAIIGDIAHGWTARLGLINLAMVRSLGIEGKVYGGTLSILSERVKTVSDRRRYQPITMHPAALRDIALVVDEKLPAGDAQKTLAKHARATLPKTFALEAANIFDVYQGKGLPEGKKSLAFSLVYRAPDRTLTDDEVNTAFAKLQEILAKETDWQIRK